MIGYLENDGELTISGAAARSSVSPKEKPAIVIEEPVGSENEQLHELIETTVPADELYSDVMEADVAAKKQESILIEPSASADETVSVADSFENEINVTSVDQVAADTEPPLDKAEVEIVAIESTVEETVPTEEPAVAPENESTVEEVEETVPTEEQNAGILTNRLNISENQTILAGASALVEVKSEHAKLSDTSSEGAAQYYGGIIGFYKTNALTNTLCIEKLHANAKNTLGISNKFAGCIAESADSAYIEFDTIEVDATGQGNSSGFGGLIDIADKSYVYAKGITIGASSEISTFTGGGLINSLKNGVLRMSGSINLGNVKPTSAAANGQIVAVREDALVYADAGWTFTRSTATVDNIGSWGDVIVFNTKSADDTNGGKLLKANVLTENQL